MARTNPALTTQYNPDSKQKEQNTIILFSLFRRYLPIKTYELMHKVLGKVFQLE